jgi:hypothetical protein
MPVTGNDRINHRSIFFPWHECRISGKAGYGDINIPTIKTINAGWANTHKLRMALGVSLVLVMALVGYYASSEHAKLQMVTAENDKLINSYSQTITDVTKGNSELNNELASVGLEIVDNNSQSEAADWTSTGVTQQLSTNESSGQVSDFASLADLIAWLKNDDTHEQVYSPTFECVDFACMMSEHAIKDGYWIFPAVNLADGHMQCMAQIGNDLYAIEPQTNAVSLWAKSGG